MNTLCEGVPVPVPEKVWDFQYPVIAPAEFPTAREASQADREIRLQLSQEAAMRAAREGGIAEGERRAEAAFAEKLAAERKNISYALEQFSEEQRRYFHRVESDVVTLALAIARKLLRREAQIDPLLLSGVVRVALDQVQAGSEVRLRCPPGQLDQWTSFRSTEPDIQAHLCIADDETVEPGQVVLETSAGHAVISLEEQLKEIESGFLDLLRADEEVRHEHSTLRLS
jgi:flagellar assembly protein FliH